MTEETKSKTSQVVRELRASGNREPRSGKASLPLPTAKQHCVAWRLAQAWGGDRSSAP